MFPQGQDQLSSIIGNPDLKPQKTVQYEIGLQQVLFTQLCTRCIGLLQRYQKPVGNGNNKNLRCCQLC